MDYAARLEIPTDTFEELEPYFERQRYEGRTYRYLPDYRRDLERGTVLADDGVVRGFPKVPRTLTLETGPSRHFEGTMHVEEKLDGYNVRIARLDRTAGALAFTRSGLICPFTTRKVRRLLDLEAFFEDHPDLMVCAELIGPENPYTAHDYPGVDSLAARVFDLRDRATGSPLPVEERRERCEAYGFPTPRHFGRFDPETDVADLRGLIDELARTDREGIVMKSPEGDRLLKYTTGTANRGDLAYAFSLPFDYGQDFMFRRLIREAFQAVEWDEDPDGALEDRAHALGEAILYPMVETIRRIQAGERVGECHTVRGADATIEALFEHLREQGLQLEIEADRTEDGHRVVTFSKRTQATNDKTRAYLDGQIVRE